jgi:hypothetical protein
VIYQLSSSALTYGKPRQLRRFPSLSNDAVLRRSRDEGLDVVDQ